MKLFISNLFVVLLSQYAQAQTPFVPTRCILPNATGAFQTVDGSLVNVNQTIANQAIIDASYNGGVSIQIFRNNCLFASSEAIYPNVDIAQQKTNIFSSTKAVVSIVTGIAYDKGLLDLDDEIGEYLPESILDSWGDAAHRALTIRQLLQENSGLDVGVVSESITVLLDVSLPQQALALPITHTPGTFFQYSQRTPDLLAYVVSRAVGQDFQEFAQENLFTPVGIPQDRYVWFRDRSNDTYGYAWLYLIPTDFARLGLVMQNLGVYNDVRVVSEFYSRQVSIPSPTNGCYGLLFWTNQISPTSPFNDTCYSPGGFLFNRSWFPSAPRDLFAMGGSPQQKNYLIPSLDMTITFMEVIPDNGPTPDEFYQFFKTLMTGILDPGFVIPGPGTYELEPPSLTELLQSLDLSVLLTGIADSPTCNILFCNGEIPLGGLISDVGALLGIILQNIGSSLNLNNLFLALFGA